MNSQSTDRGSMWKEPSFSCPDKAKHKVHEDSDVPRAYASVTTNPDSRSSSSPHPGPGLRSPPRRDSRSGPGRPARLCLQAAPRRPTLKCFPAADTPRRTRFRPGGLVPAVRGPGGQASAPPYANTEVGDWKLSLGTRRDLPA